MSDKVQSRKIDVRGCARCGGEHLGLRTRRFHRPIELAAAEPGEVAVRFERFAICPVWYEPILVEELPDAAGIEIGIFSHESALPAPTAD